MVTLCLDVHTHFWSNACTAFVHSTACVEDQVVLCDVSLLKKKTVHKTLESLDIHKISVLNSGLHGSHWVHLASWWSGQMLPDCWNLESIFEIFELVLIGKLSCVSFGVFQSILKLVQSDDGLLSKGGISMFNFSTWHFVNVLFECGRILGICYVSYLQIRSWYKVETSSALWMLQT